MTVVGLSIAASGSWSNPVGVIGPKPCAGNVFDCPWKLRGDDDQVVEDIEGELAAYSDGALLQLAGVAATKGSAIAAMNSPTSEALANLISM